MALCFHSVTACLKITLHMCIKWQDLGRFGRQSVRFETRFSLQSARFESTFLEGWEPKERPFHRTVKSLTFGPGPKVPAG